MKRYDPTAIEPKWQKVWRETKLYETDMSRTKDKFYVIPMLPYPSGDIHIGHWYNFGPTDTVARFHRMLGQNTFQAIGFDAFGLPAENAAIKNKIPPAKWTKSNISTMTKQLERIGASYDWNHVLATCDPEYYKWNQWLFLKLYEKGLAYRAKAVVNWCPKDKTVLANEQVVGDENRCERCGTQVIQKEMESWYFKITDYTERLLADLEKVDWPNKVRVMQQNWIGKSTGALIDFEVEGLSDDMAYSYVMGVEDISSQLESIGVEVKDKTNSGSFKVMFPKSRSKQFEELITKKLEPGFWNEYLADDTVFIFKDKTGKTRRIVRSKESEDELLTLCNEYAKANFASIEEMLEGNDWYAGRKGNSIRVFTTRPDTIFGATFLVLAPEHPILNKLSIGGEVKDYIEQTKHKTELERKAEGREKSGVFSGHFAINPATKEKIPIWVADYVLMGYGTGAIMAVPAHDDRDHEFAKQFKLPITNVIEPNFVDTTTSSAVRSELPLVEREAISAIVKHWSEDKYIGLRWKEVDWGTFITGGVEEGQTPEEAAMAEIVEETGFLHPILKKTLPRSHSQFYHGPKKENRFAHFHKFYFELADGDRKELAEAEKKRHEVVWLEPDEVEAFLTPEGNVYDWQNLHGDERPYDGEGLLVNSGEYDGQSSAEVRDKMTKEFGKEHTQYRLRDWLISRQRYWGTPIPIIHCDKCGQQPVPEKDLPVILPEEVEFEPTGQSPLNKDPDFVNTTCPNCDGPAKRETDTMDTFVDSSWYFLRYIDNKNDKAIFDSKKINEWAPVDHYIGGIEHAILHLLYARFITKFLFDEKLVAFDEPFKKLTNQGIILGPDGQKMSKSRGNVVSPDEQVDSYGADSLRLYMMFMGPYEQGGPYSLGGIVGTRRFLERVWAVALEYKDSKPTKQENLDEKELIVATHRAIKKVTKDLEDLGFNTAIAAMMSLVNDLYKAKAQSFGKTKGWQFAVESLVQLLAPFAPHIAEELWQELGHETSVHVSNWPLWDEKLVGETTVTLAVQVNGKVRAEIVASAEVTEAEAIELAKADPKIAELIKDHRIKKAIYVPGRLVSLVL